MANSSKLLARTRNVALALAISSVLAACGGGGGGNRNNNQPQNNVVGNTFAVTTNARLLNFDRTSGGVQTSTQITGLGTDVVIGFDVRPADNTLIVVGQSGTTGRIYRVDPASGAATLLSTINVGGTPVVLAGASFGADFNPVPDRLRLVSNTGQNLRINVATGATTVDTALTLNGTSLGVAGASYNNNFGGACRTTLFYLDTANNRLLNTSAPNDGILNVVGSFGVTTNAAANGFEFFTAADGTNAASVVLTVGGIPNVYTINTSTGAVSGAAPIQGLGAGENIVGIAASTPATVTQTAGELTALTSANQVFSFNSAAPNKICTGPTAVSGLNAGENVVGIDTRPANGMLYGVGVTAAGAGRVFVINPSTGAISGAQNITAAGSPVNVTGTNFGVDFNPVPDRLRITSDTGGLNLRVNVADGTTTVDGVTGAQITADAYTNSFGPAAPATTNLYTIDSMAGTLNVQNPPNNGTQVPVGSLGLTGVTGVSGFDINGTNNTALAGLTLGTNTATALYTINLATGAATLVAGGNIGAGTGATPLFSGTVRGMSYTAVPQATLVGVTSDNKLVTFTEAATGTLATNLAITGLASGENIVGIDARPANGMLYAVTSQGATYIINPTTGAATARAAFTPAQPPVVPAADPFTSIMGTNFGVDFNPVPDRLRLVSDGLSGNNLRINVVGGATITDGNLNVGTTVTAAAYTNSFPPSPNPAGTTTLYTIDTASDRLNIQNPPNNGVQTDVGPLVLPAALGGGRVDSTSTDGFDITGSNNLAVAVMTTAGAPGIAARPRTVFTVDLTTGIVTPIGPLNVPANSTVNGLALPINAAVADPATTVATALISGTSLAQFQVATPGTVATVGITGLAAGESLFGIDFRPADSLLYGVSTQGRIYTLNTLTGAATLVSTLSTPLDALTNSLGFDFNPVPDRLRIVTNTRQNLRINVANGLAVGAGPGGADSTLVRADPQPSLSFAAAYTNSFGLPDPTRVTTLFVIDANSNSLEVQNPPNNGVLTFRGRLTATPGVNFTGAGEFDIAGGDNGLVLAALQPVGAAQSNLYRVNLATGAAVQVGTAAIGPAGTQPLVGMTIILR